MNRWIFHSNVKILCIKIRSLFRKVSSPGASRNSFIAIPEIPNSCYNLKFENITKASPYESFIVFSKYIHNFENDMNESIENLNIHNNKTYKFDNCILEIEKLIRRFDLKFKYLKLSVHFNDDPAMKIIFENLNRKIYIANQEVLLSNNLYKTFFNLSNSNLNSQQTNYIHRILLNLNLYGGGLSYKKLSLLDINLNMLITCQMKYLNSINKSKESVIQTIDKINMSENTPDWLMSRLKTKTSENLIKIDLSSRWNTYEFLKYCKNHQIRNQVWLVSRQFGGSILFDSKLSNYKNITEIRKIRQDIANIFEAKTYSDFIFNSNLRMVKSLDEVLHILQLFKNEILPDAEKEYKDVMEYAKKHKGLKDNLMLCDYNYIYNCFALEIANCPWAKIQNSDIKFDIDKLFSRIFFILQRLFDLSFSKISFKFNEIIYSVFNSINNENIGKIIILIDRNSSLCPTAVTSINEDNVPSISIITIALDGDKPNFHNILDILSKIGYVLEGLYNKINFEISPLYISHNLDSYELVSKFLFHTFFSSKHIFRYLFAELDSKQTEDLSSSYLSKNDIFLNNIELVEYLSMSYFDLEMWMSNKYWSDVQTEIWSNFFSSQSKIYFPMAKYDEWPCGASTIFSSGSWGGVNIYAPLWIKHNVKLLMYPLINENFYEWNPNEELNPNLRKLFCQFKKLFIEDYLSCKAKSVNKFLNK